MEKACFRPQWSIPSWFVVSMEKAWFYERLFFKVVIVMVKDKKKHHKRYKVNQNQFHRLHEVAKSNITSSFRGL